MTKEMSIMIFGYDINDDEEFKKHLHEKLGITPIMQVTHAVKDSSESSVGIDVNPKDLFKDSDNSSNGNCVSRSVVVRGPKIGDVKKVVMGPNGDITVYHGGL